MTLPEALVDGYVALGLESDGQCFACNLPDTPAAPMTLLLPYAGANDRYTPAADYPVQVTVYDSDPAAGLARAETAEQSLRDKLNWSLTDWEVMLCETMQPPFSLPPEEWQGEQVYRAVFNMRLRIRKA